VLFFDMKPSRNSNTSVFILIMTTVLIVKFLCKKKLQTLGEKRPEVLILVRSAMRSLRLHKHFALILLGRMGCIHCERPS
jgi:thioredoxin-related protein